MKYANQKKVIINRDVVRKGNNKTFLCAYTENINEAMKILSLSAFQVYIYLLCNKDGYSMDVSPQHISQICGICTKTSQKAIRELQEKGYLIQDKRNENTYYFNEVRQIIRSITNPYTGEIIEMTYQNCMATFGYLDGLQLWLKGETANEN